MPGKHDLEDPEQPAAPQTSADSGPLAGLRRVAQRAANTARVTSGTTRLLSGTTGTIGAVGGVLTDPTKIGDLGDALPDPLKMLTDTTVTTYDPEELTNWKAITIYTGSIFMQRAVVRIIFLQLLTCWVIAYLLYKFTEHPDHFRTDTVQEIIKTITISIAFLLGLFLNQCVGRWWDTVKGIEKLSGAMKKMAMTSINLELSSETRSTLARRCVLSIRMLQGEIGFNKVKDRSTNTALDQAVPEEEAEEFWGSRFAQLELDGAATTDEIALLREVPANQRSFFAWSLVSKEILAQRSYLKTADGRCDTMAYDRLCGLAQDGVASVSAIKTLAAYQLPFIYVHMLAFMVHFVNILTAAGTGVSVGLLLAQAHAGNKPLDNNEVVSHMVFVVVQAFIYQAFLSIGAALSFPITGSAYNIPLNEMLIVLDSQLRLMNKLADDFIVKK